MSKNLCSGWTWCSNGICKEFKNNRYLYIQFLWYTIIAKLDDLDVQKKYIICKNTEEIEDFLKYTGKVICKSKEYVLFIENSTKLGALKLQGNIISDNIEYVISKSEFLNGGCSIFICSCSLENGVCLWRGEYDSRVYIW